MPGSRDERAVTASRPEQVGAPRRRIGDKRAVADEWGISVRTVTQLVSDRKIPFIRVTRKILRFDLDDVADALRKHYGVTTKA